MVIILEEQPGEMKFCDPLNFSMSLIEGEVRTKKKPISTYDG